MDSRVTAAEPQHPYLYKSTSWNGRSTTSSIPPSSGKAVHTTSGKGSAATRESSLLSSTHNTNVGTNPQYASPLIDGVPDLSTTHSAAGTGQFPPQIDILHFYQSHLHYAQLLNYNKLVSRGGGLQAPPLPPVVSSSNAQAGPRSRSSSKVSLKDNSTGKGSNSGGHGSRANNTSDKTRSVITAKEAPRSKMPSKTTTTSAPPSGGESPVKSQASRAAQSAALNGHSHAPISNSVPSTPHQRARNYSFESREPSPSEIANNHSPRSAYSETNANVPSRSLPPPRRVCKFETSSINSRRRIPYSNGNESLEQFDLGKIKGNLTPDEERKVATDMREVYDRLLPNEQVEEKRQKLVQKLEKIFNDEWPGHDIKAQLFGSSGNLLCSDDSDVDICITTDWKELESVCMIAELLARHGMEKVVCIAGAKVPIVKMWDPELELSCDMNVNNDAALENTRMIRTYIEIDPRVRQLAMIIKYWTRRRIVNDAAFGGTLSSYTWICLIIAFLQLRTPPVLPTLHALPYKIQRPNAPQSAFADNLKKLKGLGKENTSSEADLLFQFFRFYAHEFNYDKYILSIRLGRLMSKGDKNWAYNANNKLGVEEPFNNNRNLGNTVDDYSFKGLHQELRRAFDLISEAKFEEACEQYVFPKEEKTQFTRPSTQSRPVMVRSASQTHAGSGRGGRGGHRGGRHNGNYHRGGNAGGNGGNGGGANGSGPNRRSSNSVPTYDPNNLLASAMGVQQDLSWFPNGQFPIQYTPEMLAQIAYQQENMRHFQQQLYAQNAVYNHIQNMGGHAAMGTNGQGQAQSSDRSRTNSFDNPPLSAPLRPDLYALYSMTLGQPYFAQPAKGYGTYPSSPVTTNGNGQDYRRPLQRTNTTTEKGLSASSSSHRSQSQPAARSQSVGVNGINGHSIPTSQSTTSVSGYGVNGVANGVPATNFVAPDDEHAMTPRALSSSPLSDEGAKQMPYIVSESPKPLDAKQHQSPQIQPAASGIAIGDLSQQPVRSSSSPSRRLSSEQLPQSLLERRIRRSSRSPSPLRHSRTQSVAPGASALSSAVQSPQMSSGPVIANGSNGKHSLAALARAAGEKANAATPGSESPSKPQIVHASPPSVSSSSPPLSTGYQEPTSTYPAHLNGANGVNGVNSGGWHPQGDDSSFRERIAMMSSQYMNPPAVQQDTSMFRNGQHSGTAKQAMMSHQTQPPAIAPLDLAVSDDRVRRPLATDISLLSPVYEMRTPSPTVVRKLEAPVKPEKPANSPVEQKKSHWSHAPKPTSNDGDQSSPEAHRHGKGSKPAAQAPKVNGVNGHARVGSENGWQKAGKGKKKGNNVPQASAEQPPKRESERKGG